MVGAWERISTIDVSGSTSVASARSVTVFHLWLTVAINPRLGGVLRMVCASGTSTTDELRDAAHLLDAGAPFGLGIVARPSNQRSSGRAPKSSIHKQRQSTETAPEPGESVDRHTGRIDIASIACQCLPVTNQETGNMLQRTGLNQVSVQTSEGTRTYRSAGGLLAAAVCPSGMLRITDAYSEGLVSETIYPAGQWRNFGVIGKFTDN